MPTIDANKSGRFCVTRLAFLVAIAWVLSAAHSAAAQSTSSLQSLVNDTALQFRLAYRHDAAERGRRHKELVAVISAWRGAQRNEVNSRLLAEWLRAAIRSSMPGSRDPMPPAPKFEPRGAVINPTAAQSATATQPIAARDEDSRPEPTPPDMKKSTGDPFADDPL